MKSSLNSLQGGQQPQIKDVDFILPHGHNGKDGNESERV